jgi:FtsP/CotA-like multicopper oxidase with cupredoxin domain
MLLEGCDRRLVESGERVLYVLRRRQSAPWHLRVHATIGVLGHDASGAVRDTVLVPPMGSVAIAFDANNPGRWAFHCHNLYHMMTSVMTEVRYPAII